MSVACSGVYSLFLLFSQEACEGFFMESMLQMSLPDKILQAYNSAVAKETLKSAQVKNLVSCR